MSLRDDHKRQDEALRELGRQTARELECVEDAQLDAQHRRLMLSLDEKKPRFRLSWQFGLATALAGAAAMTLIWALFVSPSEGMRCIGSDGLAVAQGSQLENKEAPTRVFKFSEGSALALQRGTRAKLARMSEREVLISLAAGRIHSTIRHAKNRRWSFIAGSYETTVVGTQFSIEWNAEARRLEVLVKKGRVRVGGGSIVGQGLSVATGQRLIANRRGVTLSDMVAKTTPDAMPPRDQQVDAGARADLRAHKPVNGQKRPSRLEMKWRLLAKKGRYKEAVAAARRAGWDTLAARLKASDLLLLADAARFSRDAKLAQRALLMARRRFGGKHTGRIAAYRLGRLATDQLRDHRRAAKWFHTFLKEAPQSALAADALGGEMIALQRSGDLLGAKRLARQYLARYPKGAYAATARQLSPRP